MQSTTDENHIYNELVKPDTNNATYIDCTEISKEEEWTTDFFPIEKWKYYRALDRMNGGFKNKERKNTPYQTYRINLDLIATLADKLEVTSCQKNRSITLFTGLDLQELTAPVTPAELIAYCTCAYVVHSDDIARKCHPQTSDENKSSFWKDKGRSWTT